MANCLHLHIEARSETVVHLRAISEDGEQWFEVPAEEKPIGEHKHLMTLSKVKTAAADCVKITTNPPKWPKYRRIRVPITTELKPLYFDTEDDLCVAGHYPEAIHGEFRHDRMPKQQEQPRGSNTNENTDLRNLLERLIGERAEASKDKELAKLKDIKNLFLISEYDGKSNATQWMTQFIKECERLEIGEPMRSEALKVFISRNLRDWYLSNVIKLDQADWSGWKKSFIETYSKSGWAEIREAFRLQYHSGSLIEYATSKERKLLETDREMPQKYRVIQIVLGLPANVQDKIDREKTTTFDELIKRLREQDEQADSPRYRDWKRNQFNKPKGEQKIDENVARSLFVKKQPCGFCEMIGFKKNFHRLEDCKNKMKYAAAVKDSKAHANNSNRPPREVNLNEFAAELCGLGSSQNGGRSRESSDSDSSSSSTDSEPPKNE